MADRSIPLRLRRKLPGEHTVKIRHADSGTFADLVSKLARFRFDHLEAIRLSRPAEVEGLNDRANDCWEPLLAIAEVAGGDWPRIARSAAVSLHSLEEAPSIGTELLASIRDAFDSKCAGSLATRVLLDTLAEDEEAPWAEWNRGKPVTANQLAKHLSEFGIKPTTIRIGSRTPKGYRREQFEETFTRYLSVDTPKATATPQQPSSHATCNGVEAATLNTAVAEQSRTNAWNHGGCCGVADQKGGQIKDSTEYF
ncbi:hypothetical protein D9M71_557580 [compost metagenome]